MAAPQQTTTRGTYHKHGATRKGPGHRPAHSLKLWAAAKAQVTMTARLCMSMQCCVASPNDPQLCWQVLLHPLLALNRILLTSYILPAMFKQVTSSICYANSFCASAALIDSAISGCHLLQYPIALQIWKPRLLQLTLSNL